MSEGFDMATKTLIQYIDDFDGTEATETVSFALDGESFEIDLNESNADAIRDAFAMYIGHGRKVAGRMNTTVRTKTAKKKKSSRGSLHPVRRPAPEPVQEEVPQEAQVSGSVHAEANFTKDERNAMRAWGRANGWTIGERGRVPEELRHQWIEEGRPTV